MEEKAFDPMASAEGMVDELLSIFKSDQPAARILDPQRYYEMLVAKEAFDDLLSQINSPPSEITLHHMFSSASLSAKVESFEVSDFIAFQILMDISDNFEMYPLVDGNMRVAFLFERVLISLG